MKLSLATIPHTSSLNYTETPSRVFVPWAEVTRVLGRQYGFHFDDDELLYLALHVAGGPDWCQGAPGFVDDFGWYLTRPF